MTRRSILIVDPDPDTRELYRYYLSLVGTPVVEATDGREALVKALTDPPTLVLTELRLAYVEGPDLCDILRRDELTAGVPILVVTADTRADALERVKHAGASAVLTKPASPESILAEVQRLIGGTSKPEGGDGHAVAPQAPARDTRPSHRATLTKQHQRFTTTTPPTPPPSLLCPSCDATLRYERSHVGGVSSRHQEQWDYYTCLTCGTFQFRHRTRRLRRV